jgi:hypothetical protein
MNSTTPFSPETQQWNYPQLCLAFAVGVILQGFLLPSLNDLGSLRGGVAFVLDALILIRVLFAAYRRETGTLWKTYVALCYVSPFLIYVLGWLLWKAF